MSTGDILLGGNPGIDQHPVQGGATILPGMPHAMETGISSRPTVWALGSFAPYFFYYYYYFTCFFIIFAFQRMLSYHSGQVLWSNKLC